MSDKIAISRETLTVLADEHCPYGLLMAAKAIARDLLSKPALISALHENGDLIALQATVAQQAKMIEHLRGGPTPLYTAIDMANAARDGFRDGLAKLQEAYRAGWDASGEGWNAEYPCDGHERDGWTKARDKAIEAIMSKEG